MAIELAIALAAIAARTVVAQLIRGDGMDSDGWASVAADVAGALVTAPVRQDRGLGQLPAIDRIGRQLDGVPRREFEEHMAAGRRYVRDLPDTWRTQQDRLRLTRDARHEFVRAFGIAERMNDPYRQALAEVAIAGCWLWVPSLPDARKAMGAARRILEPEIVRGGSSATAAYSDVLALCRAYGEQHDPVVAPSDAGTDRPVPLSAQLTYDGWVGCAGIEVQLGSTLPGGDEIDASTTVVGESGLVIPAIALYRFYTLEGRPGELIPLEVRNTRSEWISVSLTYAAVVVRLPDGNTLPAENRVAPGAVSEMTLTRPSPPVARATIPRSSDAAVTFLLPGHR